MIEELRRTGLVRLPRVDWVDEFVAHLADKPKYPGHVKARPRPGIFCNSMDDVMAAPHFLNYAKSFTPLVSQYFGEPAKVWSLNAFYTDENTPYIKGVSGLHRDTEAHDVMVLFMLGTSVDIGGAQLLATSDDKWDAIYGRAGTAWLADTRRLWHLGLLPWTPRLLIWARWGNIVPDAKRTENLPDVI